MSKPQQADIEDFHIYVDSKLADAIRQAAEKNDRSATAEIRHRLRSSFKDGANGQSKPR